MCSAQASLVTKVSNDWILFYFAFYFFRLLVLQLLLYILTKNHFLLTNFNQPNSSIITFYSPKIATQSTKFNRNNNITNQYHHFKCKSQLMARINIQENWNCASKKHKKNEKMTRQSRWYQLIGIWQKSYNFRTNPQPYELRNKRVEQIRPIFD